MVIVIVMIVVLVGKTSQERDRFVPEWPVKARGVTT